MFNFSNSNKFVVGFSMTPGLGLEAVVLDKAKGTVVNYGRKKVDYNFAQRNIQNYSQFKTALTELIDEMKIPPKSYAYLVLPNVFFEFIELPSETSEQGIEMATTSTAEEFYIFKKEEPIIGWCEVVNPIGTTQKRFAYTAFQKTDIDEIKEIFSSVGLQLSGIETAYSATLKGLHLAGLIKDAVLMNSSWAVLLINTNNFTLFQMEGKNLLDCSDVPLAIKSFSVEEAYDAIISSVSQLISAGTISQLYIISQTDDISAEALKNRMRFDRETIAIDTNNKYAQRSLLNVTSALDFNEANSMTLSAIGAADIKSDFGLTLNILGKDPNASMGVYFSANILGKKTDITKEFVMGVSIFISIVCAGVFGVLAGGAYFLNTSQEEELSALNREIGVIDQKIAEARKDPEVKKEVEEETEIDMTEIIDAVAMDNVVALNFYDSISSDIPKNVWLTKYYNVDGTRLAVKGIAENIPDIYEYFKNLRIVCPQSDIKITELKVVTNFGENEDDDVGRFVKNLAIDKDVDRLYSFEVSNTQMYVQPKNEDGQQPSYDESNILARPPSASISQALEQTSDQMVPAQ